MRWCIDLFLSHWPFVSVSVNVLAFLLLLLPCSSSPGWALRASAALYVSCLCGIIGAQGERMRIRTRHIDRDGCDLYLCEFCILSGHVQTHTYVSISVLVYFVSPCRVDCGTGGIFIAHRDTERCINIDCADINFRSFLLVRGVWRKHGIIQLFPIGKDMQLCMWQIRYNKIGPSRIVCVCFHIGLWYSISGARLYGNISSTRTTRKSHRFIRPITRTESRINITRVWP